MRRIRKVKVDKKGKVFLQWEVEIFGQKGDRIGWDEYTMTCSDLPRPEFIDAMKGLIQDVVSLCELPDKDAEDRITVRR